MITKEPVALVPVRLLCLVAAVVEVGSGGYTFQSTARRAVVRQREAWMTQH